MADDIRLVIGVEQSGLLKAITNTESLEAKVKKLSAAYARDAASYGRYNKAIGDLAKATKRNKKELLDYGKALRADEKATKKATAEVKAFTLARKQATEEDRRRTSEKKIAVKATEDLARAEARNVSELHKLRMATDSVYRSEQKLLQMNKLLKAAVSSKTMTTQQATVALRQYNAAQVSSNKVVGMAKNKMNGSNMAIQQLGYQFGDFAVQVQGGTSAFVAFSQQGAQLAGILPMVAGPLGISMGLAVGLSAAFGVLIPIGSAIARMFFEMNGAAKTLNDTLDELEDFNKDFMDFGKDFGVDLVGNIEAVRIAFGDLVADVYEAKINLLQDKLTDMFSGSMFKKSFSEKFTSSFLNMGPIGGFMSADGLEEQALIQEQLNRITGTRITSQGQLNDLYTDVYSTLLSSNAVSEDGLKVLQDIATENGIILGYRKSQGVENSKAAEAEEERLKRVTRIKGLMGQMVAERREAAKVKLEDQAANTAKFYAAAYRSLGESKVAGQQLAETRLEDQASNTSMYWADAYKFIGESKVEGDKLAGTRLEDQASNTSEFWADAYRSLGESRVAGEKLAAIELEDQAANTSRYWADAYTQINESKIAGQELADAAYEAWKNGENLSKLNFGEGVNAAALAAGVLAKELKISVQEALKMIALSQLVGPAGGRGKINMTPLQAQMLGNFGGTFTSYEDDKPSSGGGKDFSQNEYLSGLEDEAKFKHTLVRLSAEQVTEAERRREIIMKIQSEGKVAEEDRIKTILKTEAATRKAIAAEEQRQSTMDMVTDNIENAFMSIVDGSKSVEDAFKSMLRNIILEIYQQQVAQPAATAIGGFLKDLLFADGGAFSGGSQIQAYANGGVVGGPTTFPMSGGKTGLMGEAGPEAIMPLKRGSNGKLGVQMEGGGGGDVININQSFNFQANGDDSVKKLIAQAAPKIADMAKASVIDSRRRGGSTKAAFG